MPQSNTVQACPWTPSSTTREAPHRAGPSSFVSLPGPNTPTVSDRAAVPARGPDGDGVSDGARSRILRLHPTEGPSRRPPRAGYFVPTPPSSGAGFSHAPSTSRGHNPGPPSRANQGGPLSHGAPGEPEQASSSASPSELSWIPPSRPPYVTPPDWPLSTMLRSPRTRPSAFKRVTIAFTGRP